MTCLVDDVKRAADELGMNPKEAIPILRNLDPGNFFAFGPAISREVVKVTVGKVITTHPDPQVGKKRSSDKPPAPSAAIKKVLAELKDLTKEADQEAKSLNDLKLENHRLITLLRNANAEIKNGRPSPVVHKTEQVSVLKPGDAKALEAAIDKIERLTVTSRIELRREAVSARCRT